MSTQKRCQSLEIFSGNLLEKRGEWQQVKRQLPSHTFLLVTTLDNPAQSRFMHHLGRSLRADGQSVFVLSVG